MSKWGARFVRSTLECWAYPGFVDRLVFESGDDRLTSFELER